MYRRTRGILLGSTRIQFSLFVNCGIVPDVSIHVQLVNLISVILWNTELCLRYKPPVPSLVSHWKALKDCPGSQMEGNLRTCAVVLLRLLLYLEISRLSKIDVVRSVREAN